jgi:O-antigen ligase
MRPVSRPARPRWPLLAVCAYAALIPFQPVFTMPDGSPLRFAAADAVAPLIFFAALVRPQRRVPFGLGAVAFAIPILATCSTVLAAGGRPISMYSIGKTGGLFYLVGLCLAIVRCTRGNPVPVITRSLAMGAFVSAVIGLVGWVAYLGGIETSLISGERLCSTMPGDPNIYGSLAAIGLLLTATEQTGSWVWRLVRSGVLVLALLAAGSRSAMLGATAAMMVYAVTRTRDPFVVAARSTFTLLAAGIVVAGIMMTNVGANTLDRIWEHHWREFTVTSRLDLYQRALEEFEENPVTGLGVGGFHDMNSFEVSGEMGQYVVHDTYLWALVDLGALGGLLVAGLILGGAWRCVRSARGRPMVEGAAVVAAGIAAMAVFNLFIDGFYQRHFWVLMACALCLPIYRRAYGVGQDDAYPTAASAAA